jgi:hypothetical protein
MLAAMDENRCWHESSECMQLLLAAHDPGGQVRAVNKRGMNALMFAVGAGYAEGVEMLLTACEESLAATQCQATDE